MLKRDITYIDANGEKVTDTFYFNLNEVEIVRINADYKGGIEEVFKRAAKTGEQKELFEVIERIILSSYGERTEDGKGFTKNDILRNEFMNSFAYNALFKEIGANDDAAATFIKGVMPSEFSQDIDKALLQKKVVNLPPAPPKE
jgi:hypothetical protein